ncbi:hypothetical protein WG66_012497 [Moniliophthora roreri]|nr:hypothetical protein WG66_012497 [Moniliophthora roreri]
MLRLSIQTQLRLLVQPCRSCSGIREVDEAPWQELNQALSRNAEEGEVEQHNMLGEVPRL